MNFPKNLQYVFFRKRGGGWSKAILSFSEDSSIFASTGVPNIANTGWISKKYENITESLIHTGTF